jgi:hypothetical protein
VTEVELSKVITDIEKSTPLIPPPAGDIKGVPPPAGGTKSTIPSACGKINYPPLAEVSRSDGGGIGSISGRCPTGTKRKMSSAGGGVT